MADKNQLCGNSGDDALLVFANILVNNEKLTCMPFQWCCEELYIFCITALKISSDLKIRWFLSK